MRLNKFEDSELAAFTVTLILIILIVLLTGCNLMTAPHAVYTQPCKIVRIDTVRAYDGKILAIVKYADKTWYCK